MSIIVTQENDYVKDKLLYGTSTYRNLHKCNINIENDCMKYKIIDYIIFFYKLQDSQASGTFLNESVTRVELVKEGMEMNSGHIIQRFSGRKAQRLIFSWGPLEHQKTQVRILWNNKGHHHHHH